MTTKPLQGPGCPCSLAGDLTCYFQILKEVFGVKVLILLALPAIFFNNNLVTSVGAGQNHAL